MLKLDLPHSPYLHGLPCRVLRESPHARPERVYALVWETEIKGGLAAVLADLAVREG